MNMAFFLLISGMIPQRIVAPVSSLIRRSLAASSFVNTGWVRKNSAGENLGYADKKTQERTILFYLEQADDSLAFLKKEMESRTKLYRSLGMAAGLFILVLFA